MTGPIHEIAAEVVNDLEHSKTLLQASAMHFGTAAAQVGAALPLMTEIAGLIAEISDANVEDGLSVIVADGRIIEAERLIAEVGLDVGNRSAESALGGVAKARRQIDITSNTIATAGDAMEGAGTACLADFKIGAKNLEPQLKKSRPTIGKAMQETQLTINAITEYLDSAVG